MFLESVSRAFEWNTRMASQLYDRYVNNGLLMHLSRPQHHEGCSIASLTTAVNYLFGAEHGLATQEEFTAAIGIPSNDLGIPGGPGNKVLLEWFRAYAGKKGLQAECGILLDGEDVKDSSRNNGVFEELKAIIRGCDTVLVYHLERHYNIVCGFVEHALKPADAYAPPAPMQRWLILADASLNRDPIWSIPWQAMCDDFRRDRRHCLLAFSRTG